MTISRVKPSGWSLNETLSSAQATQLDQNIVKALDKTVAGDTLAGTITVSAAAGFTFQSTGFITLQSGSITTYQAGAVLTLANTQQFNTGYIAQWNDNLPIKIANGKTVTVQALSGSATWAYANTITVSANSIAVNVLTVSGIISVPSASIQRESRGGVGMNHNTWIIDSNGLYNNYDTTSAGKMIVELDVPHGATLTDVTVFYRGASGHGALPATKPAMTVYSHNLNTDTQTTIGTATDTAASVPAYEVAHSFGLSGLSTVIARTVTRYFVAISGETSTNAVAGAKMLGVTWTANPASVDPGG